MRALVLGSEQRDRIAAVRAHAEANVIPFARVYRMAHGLEPSYYAPEFMAQIPVGFRVVYGVEEQQHGPIRHLSMSIDSTDHWPNLVAVEMICEAFGMPKLKAALHVYSEQGCGQERRNIVNVIARYDAPAG